MNAAVILSGLRAGERPDADALRWFAQGLVDGSVSDAQAGAFAMAVCQVGLGDAGRAALTEAMRDSGDILHWGLPGPVLDKHSTGGVGDCVSIILAPALAACGAFIPMVSGRGLSHSGGTLDKLEAIPGLRTDFSEDAFQKLVADVGCAIVGASDQIAPADKRLYAIRNVTGTVGSIDLITASILSKKLAAGVSGLVMDVKVGSGAFMPTLEDARNLARAIVSTASEAGCPTVALISDMSQPLAPAAGNAVEITECMAVLHGDTSLRLANLTCELGGNLLALGGLADDVASGISAIQCSLEDGRAAEVFARMVAAQGGPLDFVDRWQEHLPQAPVQRAVPAPLAGYIHAIDTKALGLAVVDLGGGRRRESDVIDPSVGLTHIRRMGKIVHLNDPIAYVHARTEEEAARAVAAVQTAFIINDAPAEPPQIHDRISI